MSKISLLFWTLLQKYHLSFVFIDFFVALCNNYNVFKAHIAQFLVQRFGFADLQSNSDCLMVRDCDRLPCNMLTLYYSIILNLMEVKIILNLMEVKNENEGKKVFT